MFFTATPTPDIYTLSLHDALPISFALERHAGKGRRQAVLQHLGGRKILQLQVEVGSHLQGLLRHQADRKSTRLNSSHLGISYAVFCLKNKNRFQLKITVAR